MNSEFLLIPRFPFAAETVLAVMPGLLPPGKWWEHPDLNGDSFGYDPTAFTNYAMFPETGFVRESNPYECSLPSCLRTFPRMGRILPALEGIEPMEIAPAVFIRLPVA